MFCDMLLEKKYLKIQFKIALFFVIGGHNTDLSFELAAV